MAWAESGHLLGMREVADTWFTFLSSSLVLVHQSPSQGQEGWVHWGCLLHPSAALSEVDKTSRFSDALISYVLVIFLLGLDKDHNLRNVSKSSLIWALKYRWKQNRWILFEDSVSAWGFMNKIKQCFRVSFIRVVVEHFNFLILYLRHVTLIFE